MEHRHRYKINLEKSAIGLKHGWLAGNCEVCKLALLPTYVDMDKVEITGDQVKTYYYTPPVPA